MNKDIERVVGLTRQVDTYIMSSNGYDIYDLMVDLQPGYLTASHVLFYSEDKKVIDNFLEAREKGHEEAIQFLKENPEHLMKMHDLKKRFKTDQASHGTTKAFKNLITKEARQATLKKGSYGSQHLINGNEILIFASRYGIQNEDLNNTVTYQKNQQELRKQYESGTAKPEEVITGHCFERLYEALSKVSINSMTQYQRDTFAILTDYVQQYDGLKMELQLIGDKKIVSLSRSDLLIDFELPKEKAEYSYMGNTEKVKFYDFLVKIHGDLLNQEVRDLSEKSTSGLQKFMNKLKL